MLSVKSICAACCNLSRKVRSRRKAKHQPFAPTPMRGLAR
jgi:hypothetical protein